MARTQTMAVPYPEAVVLSRQKLLRHFSKVVAWTTLVLIFVGGMVTSTDSGLSVPDWPLSFGMVFPPMVGGVFYEHGHRMVAALDGIFILCLTVMTGLWESRRWVRGLAIAALGLVVAQGILGGMTVLLKLPVWTSASHAVMAQTLLVVSIILAYSQSGERAERSSKKEASIGFVKMMLVFILLIYFQLIVGAVMRHTDSGLAIPDFPKMGGTLWPLFDQAMLARINAWRTAHAMTAVTMSQVVIHSLHRLGAFFLLCGLVGIHVAALKAGPVSVRVKRTVVLLDILLTVQILLGMEVIWSLEQPVVTSVHVVCGAGVLGLSALLCLRAAPLTWSGIRQVWQKG